MVITKYFKKPEKEATTNIQVRLPSRLIKELRPFMKANHLSWKDIFMGSITAILEQTKGKK